ncbi:Signal peptide peptidase-like 2A [Liparis tanakae]|uniref:Signal peptide peptidase-like 2A n=1 Tax=Liparis tanakae TaxID=230148 RepID=A0A4Z2FSJ4_9TELE|nr:Signal peptide peptidase-like 2A [Liparis tanakae]
MERAVTFLLLSVGFFVSQINCQEAILHISNGGTNKEYCIVYNHSWTPLSQTLDAALQYPVVNMTFTVLCNTSGVSPEAVKGNAVVVMRGDCDFSQKALVAQSLGATTLLIASNTLLITPSANASEYAKVQIPLALMRYRDYLEAQQVFGEGMQGKLYAPPHSKIDASIAVMLLIAMVTIVLGGWWSGASERDRLNGDGAGGGGGGGEGKADGGELFLYSPLKVVLCVALMSGMLILMYFFYNFLVYVIIVIFCLASASALFSCLDAILDLIGCGTGRFSVRSYNFSVRSLILASNGVSIMVQVALGPDASGEKLPVVMRVPRFSAWAQNLCGMQFSILGYGDIIIPGLLVAYCSRFDVWINSSKKVYFLCCCTAYLVGMVVTFAVMLLSGAGQPALLYLVPFTLITCAVVAACRGEMKQFWAGTTYEVRGPVLDSSREPLLPEGRADCAVEGEVC